MLYLLLALVIAVLVVDKFLQARAHQRELERVTAFSEEVAGQLATELGAQRMQVSEMATRIQHPEVIRPEARPSDGPPPPPTFDDEYGLVGKILSGNDDG